MKFIPISENTKFEELAKIVGRTNLPAVLARNNLYPSADIGQQFKRVCESYQSLDTPDVSDQRKISILNTMVQDRDVYEKAALASDEAWKVISGLGAFPDYLRIPESIVVPTFGPILGNGQSVAKSIINKVKQNLLKPTEKRKDMTSFFSNPVQYAVPKSSMADRIVDKSQDVFSWFKIPWGEVTLFSSISEESMDFPVYPEDPSDKREATYSQMPDMLYQYEPWQLYQSSGPRSNSYKFHMHRDMWTGDHRDGKASSLIRFCESNCYADYNGSTVNTPTVTLYISGKPLISGILTEASTEWSGPIGLDSWYLEFTLTLTITEVAKEPLNYRSVRNLPLIG